MAPTLQPDHSTDGPQPPSSDELFDKSAPAFCSNLISQEPVAVIGFSLKFPQEATTPEGFWSMLLEKRCAMTDWPSDRLNLDAFYHPDQTRSDTFATRGANFTSEDIAAFDAPFFSITSTEAMCMDPQQRISLEIAYRALENAGITLAQVSGTNTGVYMGAFADDFKCMAMRDLEALPRHASTGSALSLLANRLSWFFNLSGPSMNIDTACSSSMVALDIASQGLKNGDIGMALVAGSNLIFGLENMLNMSNMNFFSTSGKCFSFDHRADGYSRGEGFAVIIVKLLSNAIRDGDTIRGVIRSTGSNQDGRTPGITQPSSKAQAALIKQTYEKAGLDMEPTRFFEAHGTGTAIGDPVEAEAIGKAFGDSRSPNDPLYIGAVKSNIGHLEGSSGLAGLIKSMMVLEKGIITPNANFDYLNPKIRASALSIKIPLVPMPWPAKGLRRASVNSFGFGGSNSHAVLDDVYNYLNLRGLTAKHCTVEEPPPSAQLCLLSHSQLRHDPLCAARHSPNLNGHSANGHPLHNKSNTKIEVGFPSRHKLLVWSAADEGALGRMEELYNDHLIRTLRLEKDAEKRNNYLSNLAYTLSSRRSSLPWKSFAIIQSVSDVLSQGISFSRPVRSARRSGVAYVFTGQGAQLSGMGKELLVFDVFKETLGKIEKCLGKLGCKWSLKDELLKPLETSNIHDPTLSQPICTALQIALVDLLRSFNIIPSAAVGHSSGEIAAAYCVGGLSLESACRVSYFRGKLAGVLAQSTKMQGTMMSVGISEKAILHYLQDLRVLSRNITVACINSPENVTVAGDESSIDELKAVLESDHIYTRKLVVGLAYHSKQMNAIAEQYLQTMQDLATGQSLIPPPLMISSVTGTRISVDELCQGKYWVKNMVSPVRFSDAMVKLTSQATNLRKKVGVSRKDAVLVHEILELGPHSALRGPIKAILEAVPRGREITYESLLLRNTSAIDTALRTVGRFFCIGYPVSLHQVNGIEAGKISLMSLPDLPEYPFDHSRRYWYESRISQKLRFRKYPHLDLLGTPVADWNPLEARWRKIIRITETPWVEDHKVNDAIIYPAAAILVMAIEAAKQTADPARQIKGYLLQDTTFHRAVNVPADDRGLELQLYMRPLKDTSEKNSRWSEFRLCSYQDEWVEHCRGTIHAEYEEDTAEVDGGCEAAYREEFYKDSFAKKTEACYKTIDNQKMYQHFRKIGMMYGQAFQALQNATFNDEGEAMAEVQVFDWSSHEVANHVQPHVIHPVTLDAAAQLIFLALTQGAKSVIPTTIPTRIRRLWVSSTGLSHPATRSIKAYTRSAFKGYRGTESSLFALDTMTGDLRLVISKLETTTVASHNAVSQDQMDLKHLCYQLDCRPDIDTMGTETIQSFCKVDDRTASDPVQFFQDIGLLLFFFISRTVDQLDLTKTRSMKPHISRYIEWMHKQLQEFQDRMPPHRQLAWKNLSNDTGYINALSDTISRGGKQGKLFVTVGENLRDILHGRVDPLSLLFENELVEDYYEEIFDVTCCQNTRKYFGILAHKNPGMKILELGAGTGGMTRQILSAITSFAEEMPIPRYAQYDYTDVSGSYFEKAKKKLGSGIQRMNFQLLNIENNPGEQGFELGTYDLVIAGLVLHATRNLEVTLQNVRKLLKPGGKLVLFEIVVPDMLRTGFVFGLLPGWWLSSESYREWSPCVSETRWNELLLRSGFSGVDIAFHDYVDESCHEMGIIISTATDRAVKHKLTPNVAIIIDAVSPTQTDVASHIQNKLQSTASHRCNIISLREAASSSNSLSSLFLISLLELENPLLHKLNAQAYRALQTVLSTARQLLWVMSGGGASRNSPNFGMVDGLARVLRSEDNKLAFVTLALETPKLKTQQPAAALYSRHIIDVYKEAGSKPVDDVEPDYIEQDGLLHINRLVEAHSLNQAIHNNTTPQTKAKDFGKAGALAMTVTNPGLLDSLRFVEDLTHIKELSSDEIEIKVKAVGVNFMDCLAALGRVNKGTMGGECAGVVSKVGMASGFELGDRVCAAALDCFKTYARCKTQLVVKIPDDLSFKEAASLPVTGVTAHYALIEFARLKRGESILIHSATGGTGQMAVQFAQSIGAEIYATVGSDEKKAFLIDTYGIPKDHILYSRDISFAQGVMRLTCGRGVDVVLNSLSGDFLNASWDCIADFGRFAEIGKKDIHSYGRLPMFPFRKNASFGGVDLDHIYHTRPEIFRKSLLAVISMFSMDKLRIAQPLHVLPVSEVEDALRYMQNGKRIGKTVVEFGDDMPVKTILSTRPTYTLEDNATYLVVGGLGGIGRSIARWLVERGAKNLILLSRSGPREDVAYALIEELTSRGVHVKAPPCDVTISESLSAVLKQCVGAGMPPIKGCIQGAMVLRDALFEKMTYEEWLSGITCKVRGSWNLHTLLPRNMDFFVMLSSLSGIIGNPGQANYAAGNTYEDSLAHYRIARGEKAVSLDLGWIETVGRVAETESLRKGIAAMGYLIPISDKDLLALLDHYCNPSQPLQTPLTCQVVVGLATPAVTRAAGTDVPSFMQRPMYRAMHWVNVSYSPTSSASEAVTDYAALFAQAGSVDDAGTIVAQSLAQKLSKALSMPSEDIDLSKPLHTYGVDSLLAVELRNWFAKEVSADIAIFDIMGSSSIAEVSITVAGKSLFRNASWAE